MFSSIGGSLIKSLVIHFVHNLVLIFIIGSIVIFIPYFKVILSNNLLKGNMSTLIITLMIFLNRYLCDFPSYMYVSWPLLYLMMLYF